MQLLHACSLGSQAAQKTRLTIATVNNGDMVVMQELSRKFEQANPNIMLPHLGRAIAVVAMIETIFFLTIFAEIFVTTGGGPGLATTNLAYYIFLKALLEFDVGGASAGGLIAVVLANIVAIFLMRSVARNLDT